MSGTRLSKEHPDRSVASKSGFKSGYKRTEPPERLNEIQSPDSSGVIVRQVSAKAADLLPENHDGPLSEENSGRPTQASAARDEFFREMSSLEAAVELGEEDDEGVDELGLLAGEDPRNVAALKKVTITIVTTS